MMAAAQPFLCGAISKTINMAASATVEDVSQVYRRAWVLKLKAVAIYRDKSKASQPLTVVAAEPDADGPAPQQAKALLAFVRAAKASAPPPDHADERVAPPVINVTAVSMRGLAARAAAREEPPALARGEREHPGLVHSSITAKMVVGGVSHHFTVGQYDNGRPCEVFVVTGKQGSTVRGWADAFGVMLSLYLQAGGDPETAVEKLRRRRFEPAGLVSGAPLGIRTATSPVDALAQLFGALGAQAPAETPEPAQANVGSVAPVSVWGSGEVCSHCGSGNMQRAGTCLTCADCGTSSGCG